MAIVDFWEVKPWKYIVFMSEDWALRISNDGIKEDKLIKEERKIQKDEHK